TSLETQACPRPSSNFRRRCWRSACSISPAGGGAMSQRNVGCVIDRLVTDGELRDLFALDPLLAIAELHSLRFALTPEEIDAFVQSDFRCWCCEKGRVPGRLH